MANVNIGHASIDENGKVKGGKIGDQTNKEIFTRSWYNKPWNVYLECTDSKLADKAATYMEQICEDNNFGYDQSQRTSGYFAIVNNGKKVKGAKGEFDCSSLIMACYKLAGLDIQLLATGQMKNELLKTGKFKEHTSKVALTTSAFAKRGGVYIAEGKHTVMALNDGCKAQEDNGITPTESKYYPKCLDMFVGLVEALDSLGIKSTKEFRKKIAAANGVHNYSYTAEQNDFILKLLKQGKLIKP